MYPIESYRVAPNLFGVVRWQAEITGQRSRFARRAYSQTAAERKIANDENALYDGGTRLMQTLVLPLTAPIRHWHDQLCQRADRRRRSQAVLSSAARDSLRDRTASKESR
ncbi:hypothetical protein CH252_19085 [Rhodococcus sp. 06-1477-1B]|nr:hypothetical protein CH252_19085 [Rhodococcus sp. 06-1477-1B]